MRFTPFLIAGTVCTFLLSAETFKPPINNDDVKVLEVVVRPHEKNKMHEHKANRVMIYRNVGAQAFEYEGRKKSILIFKENEVIWSPGGGMHAAAVSTLKPVSIIEIELKKPGAGKKVTTELDPFQVDPKHYKLEFENDQILVTDLKTRFTSADGKVEETPHKAGDIVYGGAAKHSEINTLDHPIEVIVTELKY